MVSATTRAAVARLATQAEHIVFPVFLTAAYLALKAQKRANPDAVVTKV